MRVDVTKLLRSIHSCVEYKSNITTEKTTHCEGILLVFANNPSLIFIFRDDNRIVNVNTGLTLH